MTFLNKAGKILSIMIPQMLCEVFLVCIEKQFPFNTLKAFAWVIHHGCNPSVKKTITWKKHHEFSR